MSFMHILGAGLINLLHELHIVLRELNNLLDKYATLVDAIGVIGSCIVDGFLFFNKIRHKETTLFKGGFHIIQLNS